MGDADFWDCPNCGSADFVEVTPYKHRCAYCGTVLTSREPAPDLVTCPHCGFDNERGDRYCNNCGRPLVSWAPVATSSKRDPALTSIIVTVVGSFFAPILGAIVGLVLANRALKEARAGGGGSEKLAKTAVLVGWGGIALGLLPLCITVGASGAQLTFSTCEGLFQALSDMLAGG